MTDTKGAEERLMELGLKAIATGGVRGLKVRRLCAEAGVSPGTFTSFFGTRDAFAKRVLQKWYAGLAAAVQPHLGMEGSAIERLRAGMKGAMRFVQANAGMLLQLFQDAGAGVQTGGVLAELSREQHLKWLAESLKESQAAGDIIPGEPEELMVFLLGAISLPYAVSTFVAPATARKIPKTNAKDLPVAILHCAMDSSTMEQRLDWALQGISPKHLTPGQS